MMNKNCELCNGSGWYGDNGPGRRGNREYVPCEECNPNIIESIIKHTSEYSGHIENLQAGGKEEV